MNDIQKNQRPTQYLNTLGRAHDHALGFSVGQNNPINLAHSASQQSLPTSIPSSEKPRRTISINISFKRLGLLKNILRFIRFPRTWPVRVGWGLMVMLLIVTEFIFVIEPRLVKHTYAMGSAEPLLPTASPAMEKYLTKDDKQAAYIFNAGYNPLVENKDQAGGPRITATAHIDPAKGLVVTDASNKVDFTIKPKFALLDGQQNSNRIVYPLKDGTGWLVYTMQGRQVKEDIVLRFSRGDRMTLKYEVALGAATEMRMQPDGSINVYGSDLPLYGNVSTGSDKDKELLLKAQQKAPKNKLLFSIPAPVIVEEGKTKSNVESKYIINGNEIRLEVRGLKKANYPLSIDPSVYVTSAQQFMRGNNESNIDFDTTNELIQKSKLTGARIPSWTSDLALTSARWNSGYAVGGGYAYVVGGINGGTSSNAVYWAQFSTSNNTLVSPPAPIVGSGCSGSNWCTNSAYNLPASRAGLSAVVYNGYLYAIGGVDSGCATTNNVCNTVYYAKIGANGEPISWNTATTLVTGRRFSGAVAYNNKLYVVGGQTSASLNGDQTIEAANILPDGSLSSWSTTGMTSIPTAGRWGMTVLQNNGYLYLIGGASTTTATATVQYVKIKTDGTLDTWVTSSSFANARMAFGGTFATIYGNYMYITSGCVTLTTTSCSTFTSTTNDFQLASLNADGSITGFSKVATPLMSASSTAMTGYGLVAWRGALYGIGGCTAVSTATNCSGTTQTQVKYGPVNSDGDVSSIFPSPSSNFYASAGSPSPAPLSDLPASGTGANQGGRMASGVVVNNGFIYNIGGCTRNDCTTMSDNTSYAQINSDGTLGAWTTDSTHTGLGGGTTGLGAFGVTVYNNTVYTVGGSTGAGDYVQDVYRATLNPDGTLNANWAVTAAILPDTPDAGTEGYAYAFAFARAIPNNGTQGYLYMIGGCYGTNGIGCSGYMPTVQRCTITNAGGAPGSCTTTGQQQLKTVTTRGGLGIFGGAVYGNYVYLAGGANSFATTDVTATGSTCTADPPSCGGQMNIVQYGMVDSSGNITRADGTVLTGTSANWNVASSRLTRLRRRTVAFAVNGYLYIVAGHDGTTGQVSTLNDIQRGKINVNTGDVTGFAALTTVISDRWDLRAAQANGYIYILGGCTLGPPPGTCGSVASGGSGPTGTDGTNGMGEYVQVYNNWSGSPASYTSSTNRPATDRYGGSATILNGYLYLAGGCTSNATDCSNSAAGTTTNDVSFAPLAADGSIGSWTVATNGLTTDGTTAAPRAFGRLETVGGTLYYIGGQANNAVAVSTVLYSTPNAGTGQPAAWATASNGLPAARSQASSAIYNGRIYLTGGFSGTNATPTNTVYYSPDLSAGGNIGSAWTNDAGTSFQLNRSGHVTMAYGDNLYVMGGFDGTNYLMDVQFAPIAADGSIGTWVFGTSLPQLMRQADSFAINGFMYIFGGRSASTTACSGNTANVTNNTYVAPINADGSLGVWSQTSVTFNTFRWGVAAAYDGGRTYLLGGICSTTLTGNDRAVFGTLQLQPQLANYSIMIDTDTNVFPSKYLINGLGGGVAAGWFLRYISSTSAANSWGQSTNAGKVVLGTPGTYTPLDGAGTDTNTTVGARYYMMFLTIDVQKAFGFPEDITRGPNIYDVTLLFTSDPGKRLIHGKTFIGGQQQPLDTPF